MKKQSRSKKGSSLAEVLVSVFLLTMCASFIVSALVQAVTLMASTKAASTQSYTLLRNTENEIDSIKAKLAEMEADGIPKEDYRIILQANASDKAVVEEKPYTLFGASLTGYPTVVTEESDERVYENFVIVGQIALPELQAPKLLSVSAVFPTDFNEGQYLGNKNPRYAYAFSGKDLSASYTRDELPTGVLEGAYTYRWFASSETFYIPYGEWLYNVAESDSPMPSYDKYAIIPGVSVFNQKLFSSIISQYAGKHIYVEITPSAGNTGKMGTSLQSTPVYVSALPADDHTALRLHYDASASVVFDEDNAPQQVTEWENMVRTGDVAVPAAGTTVRWEYGMTNISGPGGTVYLDKQTLTIPGLSGDLSEFTLFIVAATEDTDKPIIGNGQWSVGLENMTVGGEEVQHPDSVNGANIIVVGTTDEGQLYHDLNASSRAFIDGAGTYSLADLVIGDPDANLEISEIILYEKSMDSASISSIYSYLYEKYTIMDT